MARSAARKKLLDQLPSAEEMAAAIANLKLMDDAAVALMSASYLDYALEILIKSEFKALSKNDEKRMFDGAQNGILATFSSKIRIAYAMGWLIADVYSDLLIINDIRNAFAHSLHNDLFFTNEHIAADCKKLKSLWRLGELKDFEPERHPVPLHLFIETAQYIYATFKTIADKKREVMEAYRQVFELAQSADSAPSRQQPSGAAG